MSLWKGVLAAVLIGGVAFFADALLKSQDYFSPGASALSLAFGAISAFWVADLELGGAWMTKHVMPVAIVLLGFGLDVSLFGRSEVGVVGLSIAGLAVVICLSSSYWLGRMLGLEPSTAIAIGAGGAICGNSAVIAVAPSLRLSEDRFAVILAMVNLLGLATFAGIPVLSAVLGFSQVQGGIWAGAVVHAVPQAVAAGESIGDDALIIATAVKLFRVSLLIFVVPLCAWIGGRIHPSDSEVRGRFPVPYFVPGFVLAACLSTWVLPGAVSAVFMDMARLLLIPLLAAVGFFINKKSIQHAGGAVLTVGLISTILMVLFTFFALLLLS